MLLSGLRDDGTTGAQLVVNVKKASEITVAPQLLEKIPASEMRGAVASADQMHTQRRLAVLICGKLQAGYVFTIGGNQPGLYAAADALPWESVAGEAWTAGRGHGRIDVRTIKTLPATSLARSLFPHVEQVFLVERYSCAPSGILLSAVAVPGITSLTAEQAGPGELLACLRGHWSIEMHHYVVLGEDSSRTGRAHRAMAAVRNAVIGALRLRKIPNIAAQLRACHRDPYQLPLLLLGLMTPLAPNRNPAVT